MRGKWFLGLGIWCLLLTPGLRGGGAKEDVAAVAAMIDARIASWCRDLKQAPLADDAEFFRRIHLDLAGRIPSVTEIRDFLDDDRPDKRLLWVERILHADPEDPSYRDAFVNHFTNVWRAWLLAQTEQQAGGRQPGLEAWLRHRLKGNVGYDQMVRDLLYQPVTGNQGQPGEEGSAVAYYHAHGFKPENIAGSTARLFMGVKLECAQCHDHPFAKWTRTQFWQFAGFFTDVIPQGGQGQPKPTRGELKIPGKDKPVQARFLDGKEPKWKDNTSTRPILAEWLTAADNPYFARAAVNRMWTYFFGSPLAAESEGADDASPVGHKELLDELARQLAAHNYDLKFLSRAITASQAYQRTSLLTDPGQKDPRLFARMPLRGLSPEQLFDSLAEATEYTENGPAFSDGAFVGVSRTARNQFLGKFAAQEQKTEYQTSILQALYLMNNEFIADRTSLSKNRTLATLAEQRTSTARKVESLYLVVLSRKPRPEESERFVHYVDKGGPARDPKQALADVFWVLLNSPEFLLNH